MKNKHKYTTVGQLRKKLEKMDDKTTIYFEIENPSMKQLHHHCIYLHMQEPKFGKIDIDVDGSQTVWCKFKGWLEAC